MPLNNVWRKLVFLLVILLDKYVAYSLQSYTNCSSQELGTDEAKFPAIQCLYDAADNVKNCDNNGSVTLRRPVGDQSTFGWVGLECLHTKPIRWAVNLNLVQSGLGDSYSVMRRDAENFYDPKSYVFAADVEIKIHRQKLNFVLACVTIDNPCERRVVEVVFDNEEKLYVLKSLSKSEESQPLVSELETAIAKSYNWGHPARSNTSCTTKFSLYDAGETYYYGFIPILGTFIVPQSVPDRQGLENAYLFSEHLSEACVNIACKNASLWNTHCSTAHKTENNKYWPVVFFTTDGNNKSAVVHAYHTLITRNQQNQNEPGRLKFAWEHSDPQDFLTMDEVPSAVYKGQTITINCNVSPFLFSYGTQIGYLSSTLNAEKMTFLNDTLEDTEFFSTRVATAQIAFPLDLKGNSKITIFCFSPVWNSSTEWVNVSREFELKEPTAEVHGSGNSKLFVLPLNTTFNTSCTASGIPLPKLTVYPPANTTRVKLTEDKQDDFVQTNIIISSVDESHAGLYNCVATNFRGTDFFEFEIKIKGLTVSETITSVSTLTIILISVFASVSAIFLTLVAILIVRFRMEKEEFKRLTEEAVREFFEGVDSSHIPAGEEQHLYANDGVKIQPYDSKYEVPHRNWSFSGTMLGSGAFGMVHKGVVEIGSRKSVIAIKTIKSTEDIDDFKATLLELKIMSAVGHHRHIVKLIAASTDEIRNRKVYIGVELCSNGSLLSYLQKRKRLFTNFVKDGKVQFQNLDNKDTNDSVVEGEGGYVNLVTSDISTIDLFKWSFQIASGMDFLGSKKVLHADLAARNILLTEDLVVRISDFGLSRELFENSEYMKKTQVVLPFKWMAPESLKYLKFSIKSDVWSYGVTLHELFTLGEEPYPGQTWSEEFIQSLESGMRLNRPPFCTENVYNQVMMQCWQAEPNNRIRFVDAMTFFEKPICLLTSSPRNVDECSEFC